MMNLTITFNVKVFVELLYGPQLALVDLDNPKGSWWPLVNTIEIKIKEKKFDALKPGELLETLREYLKDQPGHYELVDIISVEPTSPTPEQSEWDKFISIFDLKKPASDVPNDARKRNCRNSACAGAFKASR